MESSQPKLIPLEDCSIEEAAEMLKIKKAHIEFWHKKNEIRLFHKYEREELTFECFGFEGAEELNDDQLKELFGSNLFYKCGHIVVDNVQKEKNGDYIEVDVTLTGLVNMELSFFDEEIKTQFTRYKITPDMLESDIKFNYMKAYRNVEANKTEDLCNLEIEERELYLSFEELKTIYDAMNEGKLISEIHMFNKVEEEMKDVTSKNILSKNGERTSKETLALALAALVKRLSNNESSSISESGNVNATRIAEFALNTVQKDEILNKYDSDLPNLERAIRDGLGLQ